jgi:hypothetical protein
MTIRPLNRIDPALPVTAMMTHAIVAPLTTHWRKATCEEVGCLDHRNGWGLNTAGLDDSQIWTAKNSGRRFIVEHDSDGAEVLMFESGQPCFRESEHRIRRDREELFIARSGDWRGNPDGTHVKPLVFSGADSWKDSLNTNLDRCRG